MQESRSQVDHLPVLKLFIIGFCLLLVTKLFLASVLDLYSDEVFYWQASTQPALAYSDLPFMTALLIGLGSSLHPGSAFAARLLFILLGTCLPLLVYWIARPITGKQQALESATLSLCLPLGGFLGLLAVPDVPLIFFGLLSIGFFERALRTDRYRYWMATGIFVALGLSTHYRFFLYPAAAIVFLVLFKPEHKQWRNPRLWSAILLASIGLVPILWFNLTNQLSSASFYFIDRHPWAFHASGLLHLFKQAGLVTPPLYGALAVTLWLLYKKAKEGDRSAALFMSFALTNMLVYLVLAPWTDATSTSIHWPLSGYFPLLIFLPATLRKIYQWSVRRWHARVARVLVASIPVIGFTGTLIALIGVGSQGFQQQLQPLLGPGVLSNKMAGWKEFSEYTANLINQEFAQTEPIIITDNYYTAAQIAFAGLSRESITLDRDKAVRDGRIAQYELWQQDEAGLANAIDRPALFITEDSTLEVPDKHKMLALVCHHVDHMEFLSRLSLFEGDKQFSFYKADKIVDRSRQPDYRSMPCPFPARAWIDFPEENDSLKGQVTISGWAYNEDIGVEEIYLLIDEQRFALFNYGANRLDVVEVMHVESDPNAPNLGFDYRLDTNILENGTHLLAIEIINTRGISMSYGARSVVIEN